MCSNTDGWRKLLTDFRGVRNALQEAVGQPGVLPCTFNIFVVTRRGGFEVTTHSSLLCDLLDPRGSHGRGGAFLNAFLKMLDGKLPSNVTRLPWPAADGWWNAATEHATDQGRLDIVLRNNGPSGPAIIGIENKWDSGLGDQQLERYAKHLEWLGRSQQSLRTCLVYLTRNGEGPQTSLPVEHVCLSHSADISGLIKGVLEISADAPAALQVPLLQYCTILENGDV